MSSFSYGGSVEMKSEITEYEADPVLYGGYPFGIPKVYLYGEGEYYTKLDQFNWEDDSVVLVRNHCVLEYMSSHHCEFLHKDHNGNHVWVDARRIANEEDLNMEYLGEVRGATHYTVTEYDLEREVKRKYSLAFEEEMTIAREDYYRLSRVVETGVLGSHFEIEDGVLIHYNGDAQDLIIPDGITKIDTDAFKGHLPFNSIKLPKTVVNISSSSLEYLRAKHVEVASDNPKYYTKDGMLIDRETQTLIWAYAGNAIPDDGSVKTIGTNAFYHRGDIQTIVIPDAVSAIGSEAFSSCSSLEEVKMPDAFVGDAQRIFGASLVKEGDKYRLVGGENAKYRGFSF